MASSDVKIQVLRGVPVSPGSVRRCQPLLQRANSIESSYGLEWLFHSENYDHLPIEEQLKLYKPRDLVKSKIFKFARKVFWEPRSRKRVIVASSKDELRGGPEFKDNAPWTAELRTQVRASTPPTKEELKQQPEQEKRNEFKTWLAGRKVLRQNLDNLAVSEEWLKQKKDRTPMEERLLNRMIEDRKPREPTPEPDEDGPIVTNAGNARIRRPCPEALIILDEHLKAKKLRLLDLFSIADKDKSWTVSMEEFKDTIVKVGIPLNGQLLEDLVMSLDSDMNNELDYMELTKGISQWRQEQRQTRRKLATLQQQIGYRNHSTVEKSNLKSTHRDTSRSNTFPQMGNYQVAEVKTEIISTTLAPPKADTTFKERFVMGSEEEMVDMRKQTLTVLQQKHQRSPASTVMKTDFEQGRSMIKTGYKPVDNHCRPSTITGDIGEMVDNFRQARLLEFEQVVKLCKERDIPLSEKLLERALLYPGEKPHKVLRKKIRQPGTTLVSSTHFGPMQKEPVKKDAMRPKTGKKLVDGRYMYPPFKLVKPVGRRTVLSTGRAIVQRKINCWMTFEEYCRLTENLPIQYKNKFGYQNDNAFWPGMEDRVRLYLDKMEHDSGVTSVFKPLRKEKRSNPRYNNT